MKVFFETKSPSGTVRIGKRMGRYLQPGDVVALVGELGAGKTQFIKGLAAGLEVKDPRHVSSPSFTLINEYQGRIPLYHIDLFRLKGERETDELGLEEYLGAEGVTAIEWADRAPSLLPKEMLFIRISYTGKNTRSLEVTGQGKRYEGLLKSFEFGVKSSES